MDDDRCAVGVGWCARADAMFGAEGLHVLDVRCDPDRLVVTVETDAGPVGCPVCGVVAAGHGRRQVSAAGAPCFGRPVRVLWRKRLWRCTEPACPAWTWSETHPLIAPRAALTIRAVAWATDALAHDDTHSALYGITAGEHPTFKIPYLQYRGTPAGIDVNRVVASGVTPLMDVGIAGRAGGQIGAGCFRAPLEPFRAAASALSLSPA